MSEILEKCIALAEAPQKAVYTTSQINDMIKAVRAKEKALLGFEQEASRQLNAVIGQLERQKRTISEGMGGFRKFATLDMLKWRDNDGMPRVVLFGTDSPDFTITCRRWDQKVSEPQLPKKLESYYADVMRRLSKKVGEVPWKYDRYVATCTYTGLIPDETRNNIRKAKTVFGGNNVFIMAEATKWAYKGEKDPIMADPLVVGWGGQDLWLVDRFDLTSVEQLIASEFTL